TGKVRALGVTGAKRVATIPDVPTIGETVPGYEVSIFYGIAAPRGTPPEIVGKLNQAVNAVLADSKLQARLAELGVQKCRSLSKKAESFDRFRGRVLKAQIAAPLLWAIHIGCPKNALWTVQHQPPFRRRKRRRPLAAEGYCCPLDTLLVV